MLRKLIVLCLAVALSGCGFKLRNSNRSTLKDIDVTTFDDYSLFYKVFAEELENQGIKIDKNSKMKLYVDSHFFQERTLAYGMNGKTNKSNLTLKIGYSLDNETSKKQYEMLANRDFDVNPDSVLGEEYRKNLIKEQLFKDISFKLIRKMQLINDANLS